MKCSRCGRELPDDARFCLECGAPVSREEDDGAKDAPSQPSSSSAPERDGAAEVEKTEAVPADAPTVVTAPDAAATTDAAATADDGAAAVAGGDTATADDGAVDATVADEGTRTLPVRPRDTVVAGETTRLDGGAASRAATPAPGTTPDNTTGADGADTDVADDTTAPDTSDVEPTRGYARVFIGDDEVAWAHQPTDEFGPVTPAPRVEDQKRAAGAVRSRGALVTIAVGALAIAIALIAFVTWRLEFWGGKTIPDVTGQPVAEATATLEDLGFTVATREVVSDDGVGTVVSMEPTGGRRLDGGTVIALSVGVERAVPDVVGKELAEARAALAERGIDHLRLEYQNSSEPEGTIISVAPKAGTVVEADEMVTLVVAQPFTVPDVLGLSQEEAEKAIANAGLAARVAYVASTEDPGTVTATDPKASTVMEEGAEVTLSVSSPYPPTVYTIKSYLTARPQDLSTYLAQEGYRMAYGSSKDDVATMTWTGASAQPTVTLGPVPFLDYTGFQFWATDALAAGAKVEGVRLTITQASAPADAGTLQVGQQTIANLMGVCGLTASQGTTTTASSTTSSSATSSPRPSGDRTQYEAKAASDGTYTWAIVVWRDGSGDVRADVAIAPTETLTANLKDEGIDLASYDDNMADLAANLICFGK